MSASSDILKKKLIEALEKSLGVVTDACKIAECHRDTYYYHYNNDSNFKKQVDSIKDIALDFVESKLFQKIKELDTTSIIFYLKTQGKSRGYIEKTEVDQNNTGSLNVNIKRTIV